jgi:hypothetical protein
MTAVTDTKDPGRRAARLRVALTKLALWLRTALSKLSLQLRVALATLALWLAVQRFLIMPRSIDIATKLRNPPPAEVRQVDWFVREFQPQLFVTGDRGLVSTRVVFVSSDRTWRLRAPESPTSATGLPLVAADSPEPASAVTSHEHRPRPRLPERGPKGRAFAVTAHERNQPEQQQPAPSGADEAVSAPGLPPPRILTIRPAGRPPARQERATAARNRHPGKRPRNGHRMLDRLMTVLAIIQIIIFNLLRLHVQTGRSRDQR